MKKSRSSIPRFEARWPGLLAMGGAPAGREEEAVVVDLPPDVEEPPCVAITVGKTKDGSGFPAKLEEKGQLCGGKRREAATDPIFV
jgi:hypothetical protein